MLCTLRTSKVFSHQTIRIYIRPLSHDIVIDFYRKEGNIEAISLKLKLSLNRSDWIVYRGEFSIIRIIAPDDELLLSLSPEAKRLLVFDRN